MGGFALLDRGRYDTHTSSPETVGFRPKKPRTAETGVGFRLSEVVVSPGRCGGKLGGLQQALRRTPVFYPYRADSQSSPFPLGVQCSARALSTVPSLSAVALLAPQSSIQAPADREISRLLRHSLAPRTVRRWRPSA